MTQARIYSDDVGDFDSEADDGWEEGPVPPPHRMRGMRLPVMPAERDGYRAHSALFDAELAGRLYFAMRGVAYATAQTRPVLSIPRRLRVASADTR